MSPKNRAIGKAALVKSAFRAVERIADEGLEEIDEYLSEMPELGPVKDRLLVAQRATLVAHRAFEQVALALSPVFDESPQAFSGGDDKPPPPPPED